jgi:cation diffusion facilitator CzcD-associated flavoprotein CzcO
MRASPRVVTEARGGHPLIIVGAGFGGLCMAIRLKESGIEDFTILEQADEVGGTWRDNRYPGAACDVESHLYSFSFEPNPGWTRKFATQPEILGYLLHCTEKFGLRPHIRFGTTVKRAEFDESAGFWTLEAGRGETLRARAIVLACGGLSRPAHPEISGLAAFEGQVVHSARWDAASVLEGKRVAVIGTGASAIQIVPSVASQVEQLYVYQRTPPWILPKHDRPIQRVTQAIFRGAPLLQRLLRLAIYWKREALALGFVFWPALLRAGQVVARFYLARGVRDRALRAKLVPRYTMGCKRILPTDDYFQAIERGNVEVVTERIEVVRSRSIVTRDGIERALDVIVLATGFRASESVAPFEIVGRGGERLDEVWKDGAEAYLGTTVSGFPNLFFVVGPNTALGHSSMVFMIEAQVRYILSSVIEMRARNLEVIEVRPDVQRRYNDTLRARFRKSVWATGCNSWYLTRDGKNTTLWPGFTFEFRMKTRRFRASDYELRSKEQGAGAGRASETS